MFRLVATAMLLVFSLDVVCAGLGLRVCQAGEPAAEPREDVPSNAELKRLEELRTHDAEIVERLRQIVRQQMRKGRKEEKPKRPVSTDQRLTALLEEIAGHDPDLAKRVAAYMDDKVEGIRKELESDRQVRLQAIRVLEAEKGRIEQELEEAERRQAGLQAAAEKAKKEIEASVQRMNDLTRDVENMRDRLHERFWQLKRDGLGGVIHPVPAGAQPDVEGVVTAVGKLEHVEVSIGSDKGLLVGHLLDVFNAAGDEAQHVGRVQIVRAISDRAVGEVLPKFKKGDIKVGDRVVSVVENKDEK